MSSRSTLLLALSLALATACSSSSLPSFEARRAADHDRVGTEAFRKGDLETAEVHFERALELARSLGDAAAEAGACNSLGVLEEARGDADAALARFDAALRIAAPDGSIDAAAAAGAWSASLNRSRVLLGRGEVEAAEDALGVATAAAELLDTRAARAAVKKQEGLVLRRSGRPADALARAREALRLYQIGEDSAEARAGRADAHLLVGRLLREGGDPVLAVASFRAAADVATRVPDPALRARALRAIATTLEELGHLEDARHRYRIAYDAARAANDPAGAEDAARGLLRIADRQRRADRREEAEALLAAVETPIPPS